jgi:hypothetical protein
MEKLSNLSRFQEEAQIILEGFDPVSAGGFTQLPNLVLRDPDLSPQAKLAYSLLLSYAWYNNSVFPGQGTMADHAGVNQPAVSKWMQELKDKGWLEIKRRGQGKTNIYILKYRVSSRK